MFKRKKDNLSVQSIKYKSDRLKKKAQKEARKMIRKGHLNDLSSFSIHLKTIDEKFSEVKTTILNARRTQNYGTVRVHRIAQTSELIESFNNEHAELQALHEEAAEKFTKAGHDGTFKKLTLPEDIDKLKRQFSVLEKEDEVVAIEASRRNPATPKPPVITNGPVRPTATRQVRSMGDINVVKK